MSGFRIAGIADILTKHSVQNIGYRLEYYKPSRPTAGLYLDHMYRKLVLHNDHL